VKWLLVQLRTWLLAVSIVTAFPAAARGLDGIRERGQLDIGVTLFTPWAMIRNDGILTGFEAEVGAKVALDMGVTPAFHLYNWDKLIPALESGEIDVIIAGMTITKERAQRVLFTIPYSETGIDIAINVQVTGAIERLDELNKPGMRVGIVRHTLAAQVARRELPRALRIPFFHSQTLLDALADGKLDAYLGAEPGPRFAAELHPAKIEIPLAASVLRTRQGMAVHKDSFELLALLNRWVKINRTQGWLYEVQDYWFGSLGWRKGE